MLLPKRWNRILEVVDARGETSVEDLAQLLNKSPATVRRDLNRLAQEGLVQRTHGGVRPVRRIFVGRTLAESRCSHPREKEAIGRAAAQLVQPGEALFIDGGYTTFQVARHLGGKGLTVATNSLDVAQALAPFEDVKIILLGGELNREAGAAFGVDTVRRVDELIVDRAILGADALSAEEGLSTPISIVSELKSAMVARAHRVTIVADHSKLGCFALYRAAPIEVVNTLVTDSQADPALLKAFRLQGVEIVVATEEDAGQND
jgi:DeoR family transcriptional regulator of aga operon